MNELLNKTPKYNTDLPPPHSPLLIENTITETNVDYLEKSTIKPTYNTTIKYSLPLKKIYCKIIIPLIIIIIILFTLNNYLLIKYTTLNLK
jgi:hypothetical protein